MRNAALILGVIGGTVGMVVGFFAYGVAAPAKTRDGFFRTAQEFGARRLIDGPLICKLIALAAPIAAIPAAGSRRAARAVACLFPVFPALGIFRGFEFDLFTMFPIAMSAIAGLLALGGAPTLPLQSSR
jgi:hypothetical protein